MMGDETSVGEPLRTRGQFFLQLTQPLKIGRLIGSEFSRMTRVHFNEGVGNVAQHDGDIFRVQPDMWIPGCPFVMRPFMCIRIVSNQLDPLRGRDHA